MITFAVFQRFPKQAQALRFAKSGPFVLDEKGSFYRCFEMPDGNLYALRFRGGAALRDMCETEAAPYNGHVIEVESDFFPGEHLCIETLRTRIAMNHGVLTP